jgi:hypothetical protein
MSLASRTKLKLRKTPPDVRIEAARGKPFVLKTMGAEPTMKRLQKQPVNATNSADPRKIARNALKRTDRC